MSLVKTHKRDSKEVNLSSSGNPLLDEGGEKHLR